MSRLYLDHSAGRPPLPEARAAAEAAGLRAWANSHSVHAEGREARQALESARGAVAGLAGRPRDHVFFTSGGTEGAHAALTGVSRSRRRADARLETVVISALEHAAMFAAADTLAREGFRVRIVPATPAGTVDTERFVAACNDRTAVAALISGQNEIGTVQPVGEVAAALAEREVPLVVDAVQLPGQIHPVLPAGPLVVGLMSAHKMGGLAGAGAVVAGPDLALVPFLAGGAQERRRRGGTPATVLVAAMGAAAGVWCGQDTAAAARALATRRDRFEEQVRRRLDGVTVIGARAPRLPGMSALRVDGVRGEDVVAALDLRGVAASAGAACSVGSGLPSSALLALGFAAESARGLVRFSLGGGESDADVERAAEALCDAVTGLRAHARPADARGAR